MNHTLRARGGSLRSLAFALSLLVGCSSEIGEECDDVGQSDECEDGAICTNEEGGGICRAICAETADCPANHTCNGVSGTNIKSCQPDALK
ncbi:MAG TPA: hypothetical protein VJN18_01115 [Polyangiaceae bacterium]|nr:hypothetical protein [Polyangiaceae bacterium]